MVVFLLFSVVSLVEKIIQKGSPGKIQLVPDNFVPEAISFFVYPIYFTQDGHQEVFLCLERGNTKINYGDTIRFMSNNSEIICN